MTIEWNTHLFSSDVKRFPFHPRASYRPEGATLKADPLADYLQRMAQEKIDRAVIVHPEPYGDDHRVVLDALQREPKRLLGTCLFYPDDPDGPKKLRELVRREPRIIATRFHAHRGKEEYLKSFSEKGVRAIWAAAIELGLVVELHIGPNYARQVAETIRHFHEGTVLIDHLAEPHMGTGPEFADVLELSRLERVYMKLSGLSHFATDAPLFESARPFTRRVIKEFGPNRVVWGAGSPAIVDAHMPEYSRADRDKVRGGNLAKLLNWDRTGAKRS